MSDKLKKRFIRVLKLLFGCKQIKYSFSMLGVLIELELGIKVNIGEALPKSAFRT